MHENNPPVLCLAAFAGGYDGCLAAQVKKAENESWEPGSGWVEGWEERGLWSCCWVTMYTLERPRLRNFAMGEENCLTH